MQRTMQAIPLYFDLEEAARGENGDGFLATVRLRGRITCRQEEGAFWMSGVNPVGIAEYGDTPAAAYGQFRSAVLDAVRDFADWADDLRQFRAEFTAFLLHTTEEIEGEWIAARQEIRNGRVPGLDLRRETGDLEPMLEITLRRPDRPAPGAPPARSSPPTGADPLPQARLAG